MKPSLTKARKPIPYENIYPDGQYKCPVCSNAVTECRDELINWLFGYRTKIIRLKRCVECGQLLDWSDADDT